jgi:uncharacterized protein YbjT (DUF2867 family)
MRIVIIGGTGLIGAKLVSKLQAHGQDAVAAAINTGVNTVTGEGLADVLAGADVVVDVSNSRSFDERAAMDFFATSTRNLLAAEAAAGVGHHVVLSVVGTGRLSESPYFRAKIVQEYLVQYSGVPWSIVQATQFFEFTKGIADGATVGSTVRLAPVPFQPMAADDVVAAVARVAVGAPQQRMVETGGPEVFRLDEFVRDGLSGNRDPRDVVADPEARYFGARLTDRTLVPDEGARLGETRIGEWRAMVDSLSGRPPRQEFLLTRR